MSRLGRPSIDSPHLPESPSWNSESRSQIVVTVLRAENLPRLKTPLCQKRRFYITVTNGVTTRKTAARRSIEQTVQWGEELDAFGGPSSYIEVSLYAVKTRKTNYLVGKKRLTVESQKESVLLLESTIGRGEKSATVHLTITVVKNPGSASTAIVGASNIDVTPILQQEEPHEVMSPEECVSKANEALNAMHVFDAWKNTISKIEWVMNTLSPIAELHPCARMAWGLLRKIPEAYLHQVQRDEDVRNLLAAIFDAFDFAQEARALANLKPESKQVQILKLMLQHVCNCSDFIRKYARDIEFRERFRKNISGEVDTQIETYCETLKQLRGKFLDHGAITIQRDTFQILGEVRVILANVSAMDLDAKVQELPYKAGWRSDVKTDLLPGTRTAFLDYIDEWINNPDTDRGLVLFGQAGTGKSSIAHEIARRFRDMNRLTSYFVFLRREQSGNADYLLFTTLIRDLSNRYSSFRAALGAAIANNKYLPAARDYHTLFHDLLLQPLQDLQLVGPILIVIDALDESGDASGGHGLHTFLAKSVSRLPSEFRILITSRREKYIDLEFATASSIRIVDMNDDVLSAASGDDIRAYLRDKLPQSVFDQHGKRLEEKAERLFQWAAVACEYIGRPPPGLTKNDCIKNLLNSPSNVKGLDVLDQLYQQVLEGYFKIKHTHPRFRSVMGQLFAAFEPLSIASLTSLRGYASHDERDDDESVIAIVSHLGSLLSNVTSSNLSLPIAPLHTSFRDFLTDETRSGKFYVDLKRAHHDLANYSIGLMLDKLKFNICQLESSHSANKDVPDIGDRINRHIPNVLSYACRFWNDHLQQFDFDLNLFEKLRNFFNSKFLFWLEVLSVTGDVALAPPALAAVKRWLAIEQKPLNNEVEESKVLVNDASTFVRHFAMPIAKSAPHIYTSCLPFAPISSGVFKRYSTEFPHTVSLQHGRLSHWPPLEMVIPAHRESVHCISFSPDGQHLVSASRDQTVRMWNATTGQAVGKASTGHSASVKCVSFSPDGQHFVSGSKDHTIRMWNAKTGELAGEPFFGHLDTVISVSFSPDGQHLVSGSYDRTVRVWSVNTREIVGEPLTGHSDRVESVSFSPDGQHIVSGSHDRTIRMWDARTVNTVGRPWTGHSAPVLSISFSPDGQRVVSGSADRTVRIWNARTGEQVGDPFIGHSNLVVSVSFSPDGLHIASGSRDRTIRIWDTTGECLGEPFTGHNKSIVAVSFSPDGQHLASGSLDCTICLWNPKTAKMMREPTTGHSDPVTSVSFSPDGQHFISGSLDCTIRMWNTNTGEMVGQPFIKHSESVTSVSFSPDGQYIVSGSADRIIRLWNASTGETVGEPFIGHSKAVTSVSFSPDGQHFVSGSHDNTIFMWNVGTREWVGDPYIGHGDSVISVSFSPDGQYLLSGSRDRTICMWNAKTGEKMGNPFTGHTDSVLSVSFSPDGQSIASGSHDHTIRVWNLRTVELLVQPLTGHKDSVMSVSFSPDGLYLVSGSRDGTICTWNVRTGEMIGGPFAGHSDSVRSVSFSPDGQHIISGSTDHTIRIWNIRAGEMVGQPFSPFFEHTQRVSSVTPLPDVASASDVNTSQPSNNTATVKSVKTKHSFYITPHSIINKDGWICGPQEELYLWVPQLHRASLHRSGSTLIGGRKTRLDFSRFVHGRSWSECLGERK